MKKYLIGMITVWLMILLAVPVLADGELKITGNSVTGQSGETVTVKISLEQNPGISYLSVPIAYNDSALELVGFKGEGLAGWTIGTIAIWADATDSTFTGDILSLTFHIKDSAIDNTYHVEYGDIEAWNSNEDAVRVVSSPGSIIVHNHVFVHHQSKKATCVKDGTTEFWSCEGCGKCYTDKNGTQRIKLAETKIPATGHTSVKDPAKAATTTKTGLTEGSHCSVCGKVLVKQKTVPKIAVTLSVTAKGLKKNKVTIKKGKTLKLKVKTNAPKVTFKSSDKKVAVVNKNGIITAKKKGKATISVTAGNKTVKLAVTVN